MNYNRTIHVTCIPRFFVKQEKQDMKIHYSPLHYDLQTYFQVPFDLACFRYVQALIDGFKHGQET